MFNSIIAAFAPRTTTASYATLPDSVHVDFLFEFCWGPCFRDGHFMDPDSYEQYSADAAALGDAAKWLKDQDMCAAL